MMPKYPPGKDNFLSRENKRLERENKQLQSQLAEVQRERDELLIVAKAMAMVGVDFGYGPYELQPDDYKKAREIVERIESGEAEL